MFTSTYTGEGSVANTGSFANYGFIVFLLFILWLFFGMNKEDYCNQDLRAENIKAQATSDYNQLMETRNSKEAIMTQASAIRNEQQAETIFDLKMDKQTTAILTGQQLIAKDNKIAILEQTIDSNAKFYATNRRLDAIECKMLKEPEIYGSATNACGDPLFNNGFCYQR